MTTLTVYLIPRSQWEKHLRIIQEWHGCAVEHLEPLRSKMPEDPMHRSAIYSLLERIESCKNRCSALLKDLPFYRFCPDREFYITRAAPNNQPVGMMLLRLPREDSPNVDIEELTAHPANIGSPHGQKGVGRTLVEQSFRRALETNADGVSVSSALASLSFYEHLGFTIEDVSKPHLFFFSRERILAKIAKTSQSLETSEEQAS